MCIHSFDLRYLTIFMKSVLKWLPHPEFQWDKANRRGLRRQSIACTHLTCVYSVILHIDICMSYNLCVWTENNYAIRDSILIAEKRIRIRHCDELRICTNISFVHTFVKITNMPFQGLFIRGHACWGWIVRISAHKVLEWLPIDLIIHVGNPNVRQQQSVFLV